MNNTFFHMMSLFLESYSGEENKTEALLAFLHTNNPEVWEKLQAKAVTPNFYGWRDIILPGYFEQLLHTLQRHWFYLTGQNEGECQMCKEVKPLAVEHEPIVSFEFGPVFKIYEHHEMDGAVATDQLVCRQCAMKTMKKVAEIVNIDEVTCWA